MANLRLLALLPILCGGIACAAPDPLPYPFPSAAEQAQRKQQLLQLGKRWLLQYGMPFDTPAPDYPQNLKHLGHAPFLFALGSPAETAKAVECVAGAGPDADGRYTNLFDGPAAMELWFRYREQMPQEVQAHLRTQIAAMTAPGQPMWGNCGPATAGGNWGFCSVAAVGLAGEILGDAERLAQGKAGLKLALDQIRRYGTITEYNSPNYYGPSFAGLNAIASHAQDPEFRDMARAISLVLLMQTLAFYHPSSEQVSGPWQRCYMWDVYGGPSPVKSLLYPYLPQPPYMDMDYLWQWPSKVGISGWMLRAGSTEVYFPAWLTMFVTDRPWPWRMGLTAHVRRITERRGRGTVYPEGDVNAEVYQTPIYTFGSAGYVYHNGAHGETPYLAWSLQSPVRGLADFKTGFFRMLHHDALVEGSENESVFDEGNPGYVLWNEGRKFAYQHDHRAILFAHPDRIVPETTRLGLSFFTGELKKEVDEVWLGGERVTQFPAASAEPQPVVIRDGKFYLAMVPLPGNDDLGRTNAVEIRRTTTRFLQVSFLNYQGERRPMDDWDYARNGLYLETADTDRYPATEAFLEHLKQVQLTETGEGDLRRVTVQSPEGRMQADYDRRTEVFLKREYNGVPYVPSAFTCPRASMGLEGKATVGKTSVACAPPQPVVLAADPDRQVYVLLNLGEAETKATLTLPEGKTREVVLGRYEERVMYRP
jgi:hypothetical protein